MRYTEYLNTPHWWAVRKAINERDKVCQWCGSEISLNVHHLSYENKWHEQNEDLILLCKECHEKYHEEEIKIRNKRLYIGQRRVRVYEIPTDPMIIDTVYICHPHYFPENYLKEHCSNEPRTFPMLSNK